MHVRYGYLALALGLALGAGTACSGGDKCGNGVRNDGESCDGTDFGGASCLTLGYASGTLGCDDECHFVTTACEGLVDCGNGVVDTGEQCDGSDLDGQTCETRLLGSGTLACDPVTCQFDVSGCEGGGLCGDGVADGDEECDGQDLRGLTCATYDATFLGGQLECSSTCTLRTTGCYGEPDFPIGGACETSDDCDGGECQPEYGGRRAGAPGGVCVERCDENGACPLAGEAGVCVQSGYRSYCFRRCDPDQPDCRDGYECVTDGDASYCAPFCTDDDQCVVTGACDTDSSSMTYGMCIVPEEVCTGGVDEDLDGLVDCGDPDCNGIGSCATGEICGNNIDDDNDGLTDCDDGECALLGVCTGLVCEPPPGADLTCGTTLTGETNDASGYTSLFDGYQCQKPDDDQTNMVWMLNGDEYAYRLTVPSTQLVTVDVSNFTENLDVVVVKDVDGYCDPNQSCFAYSRRQTGLPESVTFAAYPTTTYYVIVDARQGVTDTYDISVTCDATTVEDCNNSTDDDGDGLIDCNDPECAGVPPHCSL